jgi:predicted DNA-binding antitoxin AbrB/MazE fold protein
MDTIHAIFENGAFRPLSPVPIPDGTEVAFEPRVVASPEKEPPTALYRILDQRFNSGIHDIAERHDEHQP